MLRIRFYRFLLWLVEKVCMGIVFAMLMPVALLAWSMWFFLVNGAWPRVTACTFYDYSINGGVGSIQSNALCNAGTAYKGVNRLLNYISNDMDLVMSGWLALAVLLGVFLFIGTVVRNDLVWIEKHKSP